MSAGNTSNLDFIFEEKICYKKYGATSFVSWCIDIPDKMFRKDYSVYEEVMGLRTSKIKENTYSQNVTHKYNS